MTTTKKKATRGRPTTKPRLRNITVDTLHVELMRLLGGHGDERIFKRFEDVLGYAKGEPTELATDDHEHQIRWLAGQLYSAPAKELPLPLPSTVVVGIESDRQFDVVLLAAESRLQIETGARVTRRGLAALASVHPIEVGRLIREGRLGTSTQGNDGRAGAAITPGAAAKWLRERGVEIKAGVS